eukprot:g738.t1
MSVYDEIELEELEYDEEDLVYYYPCPCGDKFFITLEELWEGEDIGTCPSCSLTIRVLFDPDDLPSLPPEEVWEDGRDEGTPGEDGADAVANEEAGGSVEHADAGAGKAKTATSSGIEAGVGQA